MKKKLLHVGCGYPAQKKLPPLFSPVDWSETRVDIDLQVKPDIVSSMTHMPMFADNDFDAIYSSHNLEHLYSHEVTQALAECKRLLNPDSGFLLITLPDLKQIAEWIVNDKLTDKAYQSKIGGITPHDMLFGHQNSIAKGNHYMAHKTGFTVKTLGESLIKAGFKEVRVKKGKSFDLWAVAMLNPDESLLELMEHHGI